MKSKLFAAAALIAMIAAPTLANAYSADDPYDRQLPQSGIQNLVNTPRGAFAQVPGTRTVAPFTAEEKAWFERASKPY